MIMQEQAVQERQTYRYCLSTAEDDLKNTMFRGILLIEAEQHKLTDVGIFLVAGLHFEHCIF